MFGRIPWLGPTTPDGTKVRARGRVVPHAAGLLVSPAGRRPCVAFVVRAVENAPGEIGGYRRDVVEYSELATFAIEVADLGPVIVESEFATLDLPRSNVDAAAGRHERWAAFCDERHVSAGTSPLDEGVVELGDEVIITGMLVRRPVRPGVETAFRDLPSELAIVGDFDHPLQIER